VSAARAAGGRESDGAALAEDAGSAAANAAGASAGPYKMGFYVVKRIGLQARASLPIAGWTLTLAVA
jgi:hypothetical protein